MILNLNQGEVALIAKANGRIIFKSCKPKKKKDQVPKNVATLVTLYNLMVRNDKVLNELLELAIPSLGLEDYDEQ